MKNKKQQFKIKGTVLYFIVFIFVFFTLPGEVSAARLFLETSADTVGVGQKLEVTLYLDSEGETVNALEGNIQVPEFLRVDTFRDGDTLIAFWSERSSVNNNQTIIFSGLIPGGWQGRNGKIFSFITETTSEGNDTLFLSDTQVLLHDGEGTKAAVVTESLTLRVDETITLTDFISGENDTELPEPFIPLLSQDLNIFSGDYFLVFATQDKNSGVDHYEVLETRKKLHDERKGNWRIAESPYRVSDQSLRSFIYIRAIDRSGNIRVELFEPTISDVSKSTRIFLGILLLVFLLFVGFISKRHKEHRTHTS